MPHPARLGLWLVSWVASPLAAQSGAFIARLGSDTVQIEHFTRTADRLEGMVATRVPTTRLARWDAELTAQGTLRRYRIEFSEGDGRPVASGVHRAEYAWEGDSVTRRLTIGDSTVVHRIAAPPGAVPGPSLPYLGVSYLMYELGLAAARTVPPDSSGARRMSQIVSIPGLARASAVRVWFVAPDSAEMDYFGVARSGWRLAADGSLLRADWTGTTYRYRIERVASIDVEGIARAWVAADRRGEAMGVLSPRDTVRAPMGGGEVVIDYSRPSRRGREIWGAVVPWDQVWRLGADMATHIVLPSAVVLGGVMIPAGRYTLWMVPRADGSADLVVNRRVNIFGTNYRPAEDLARIPLERRIVSPQVERLTLDIQNNRLSIRWGDVEWSAVVDVAP